MVDVTKLKDDVKSWEETGGMEILVIPSPESSSFMMWTWREENR